MALHGSVLRRRAAFAALCALALVLLVCCAAAVRAQDDDGADDAAPTAPPTPRTPEDKERDALASEGFTAEQRDAINAGAQKFEFQAEVGRLMDIIIHSLYSKRDVFIRELVSNAADALDKLRYNALSEAELTADGAPLEIRIKADKEARTLSITDTGIGMTRDELVENLGTIAHSGTRKFLEQLSKTNDVSLIGQFGVGFYSAFLVADTVTVTTKSPKSDKQYIWQSTADGSFTVTEDPRGTTLSRGTRISLHLSEDALEFAEESRLRDLIKTYSEFINVPIYLWASKTVEVEVEEEPSVPETEEEALLDEEAAEEPKKKTRSETVHDWELMNANKPIWTRAKEDITDDEYQAFYQLIAKTSDAALTWAHFNAEGEHDFKSIIYVPSVAPYDLFDRAGGKTTSIKLYVKRVFITDEFDDLLPRYLGFLRGVVDSDDLPLNVSREMLQQHAILRLIKRKLTRKALDMFKRLADTDAEAYAKFWAEFGKSIKLGIIEDHANRAKLAKLARFYSSKSGDNMTSLDEYVSRMKEGQKGVFYVAGESRAAVEASPFLEKATSRGYEVLYLFDAIDEYTIQNLPDYDGNKLVSVAKEGLKFGDETDEDKELEKQQKEQFADLITFLEGELRGKVEKVTVSARLTSSPCVIVTGQYGWSANMERLARAQALSDSSRSAFMAPRKTLEINPNHPIVLDLQAKVQGEDPAAADVVQLLYDTALLTSGFTIDDTAQFAQRMYRVIGSSLGAPAAAPSASAHDGEEF